MNDIKKNICSRMEQCLEGFEVKIQKIRTGRISVNLLDGIFIEYYGSNTPLNQLANIIVEKSNTLRISVFDNSIVKMIEKAILNSNLEINPIVIGNNIKIIFPALTEERRIKLFKIVRSEAEKSKIYIRNIRRDANDILKKQIKDKIINKDLEYVIQNDIQKLTNVYIDKINGILSKKELEIMKF